uniref:phosphatidate cytidylyltransferase n=1 Tax=Pseudo-nitzschia delicatissima TaxID=44447 RepID=A0A7S0T973_9STRA|mmetsp:Transcript_2079/g.4908  ORF Transcript_2079/g.4908 Transcript_2079/m.4908 type:complete len:498 (+) Transcript_2079:259-1752(+)
MASANGLRNRKSGSNITDSSDTSADSSAYTNGTTNTSGPRSAMSAAQVAKDEKKKTKLLVRVISSFAMISVFGGCVYAGHLYTCGVVALAQIMLFRELVKVRYSVYFAKVENTIPLFRTTQWAWFSVAIFYTYGDFISEVVQSNSDLHYLVPYAEYSKTIAFTWYSAVFVLTIATMQVGHIKFQLNQLCWTIVVLCMTLGQMKYIMHNIFNGLIWFTLPFLLVCCNDVMAYFCGRSFGRKFIKKPFIWFSPNKTWEGFIGGGICTLVVAWYLSRILAQFNWMICPVNKFELFPGKLECPDNEIHHMFVEAQSIFPPQLFDIFPKHLVRMIPGIDEICSVENDASESGVLSPTLETCIPGEDSHSFHHFEMVLKNVYPIQIHAVWLGLFASVVAPFGGFLASAIKRAYGIKDFDSLIPGHGGFTDRFDCQFLMALCTWVHYNSFCRMSTISVPKLVYHWNLLSLTEKQQFLEAIVPSDNVDHRLLRRFQEYALSGIAK